MSKKKYAPPPAHFNDYLGHVRQWIDGFEAAGKRGPAHKDVLRQVQLYLKELPK